MCLWFFFLYYEDFRFLDCDDRRFGIRLFVLNKVVLCGKFSSCYYKQEVFGRLGRDNKFKFGVKVIRVKVRSWGLFGGFRIQRLVFVCIRGCGWGQLRIFCCGMWVLCGQSIISFCFRWLVQGWVCDRVRLRSFILGFFFLGKRNRFCFVGFIVYSMGYEVGVTGSRFLGLWGVFVWEFERQIWVISGFCIKLCLKAVYLYELVSVFMFMVIWVRF